MMNADIAREIIRSRNQAESIRNRRRGDFPDTGSGVGIDCVGSSTWDTLLQFYTDRDARAEFRFTLFVPAQGGPDWQTYG
ncbi:MAG: hypothetical protein NVS1B11_33470 [Terriglobales bacterium]